MEYMQLKPQQFIKEFKGRFSGDLYQLKRMEVCPVYPNIGSHPFIVESNDRAIGCLYLYPLMGEESTVSIMYLRSVEQGKGYGTQIMQQLCEFADVKEISLHLEPYADNDSNLRNGELKNWYASFGFVMHSNVSMKREPRYASS